MIAERDAIGDHVGVDAGHAADHRAASDAAELLNRGQAAHDHAVADLDMAAELRAVGEGHVIADMAIVADMTVAHEIAARADAGEAAAPRAAETHRHVFADDAIARRSMSCAAGASSPRICAVAAQHGTGMHDRARADCRVARYRHAGDQPHAVVENCMRARRCRMDRSRHPRQAARRLQRSPSDGLSSSPSKIMALNSASAQSSSPT